MKTGIVIIKDNENNYFRIWDNNKRTFLGPSGDSVKYGQRLGKKAGDHYRQQTHIKNTDID